MSLEVYDFDTVVDRHGTDCYKFDSARQQGIPEDNLSLWVADMDFPVADCIKETIVDLAEKGIFGYTFPGEGYYDAVLSWYKKNFGWEAKKEWLVTTPGVVFAVAAAVRAFTNPGDKVLIQQPVYYPFADVIKKNDRMIVNNPLKECVSQKGLPVKYEIDLYDLEEKLKDKDLKLMIFCSPHNPVGRVWTKQELISVEELCLKYDVILLSDEIHSDFVWAGHKHTVLTSIDPRYQKNTIVCTAPSKTFNLAGLQLSNIFIVDSSLRKKYQQLLSEESIGFPNQIALKACQAAYTGGKTWLAQVKEYIYKNICFTKDFLEKNMPLLKMVEPEGTYLVWIDCRGLGLSDEELSDLIVNKAGLWLDEGIIFGKEGSGFERINVACSKAYLKKALEKLKMAYDEYC